jgi:uncharacterized protein
LQRRIQSVMFVSEETGGPMPALRDELHRKRDVLNAIAARHGISNLRIFGSVARGEERPDSDVDLLVDIAEDRGFADYLGFVQEVEAMLSRPVDVMIARSLSPHFRPLIEAEVEPL